jgi:hypothetical protein
MISVRLHIVLRRHDESEVALRKIAEYAEGPLVDDYIRNVPVLGDALVFHRIWMPDGWLLLDLGAIVPLPEQFDDHVVLFTSLGWSQMGD